MQPQRVVVVILLLLVCSSVAFTEETPPYEAFPEALGVAAGRISGLGLHYHRWAGERGYQLTAGALYLPPTGPNRTTPYLAPWGGYVLLDYNVGGAYQRRVYADRFNNWFAGSLYLFAGGNHRGYIPMEQTSPDSYEGDVYVPAEYAPGGFQAEITGGVGIGIELILFRHISIPAEFGYGGTWTVTEPDLMQAFAVQLYGQAALRYRY